MVTFLHTVRLVTYFMTLAVSYVWQYALQSHYTENSKQIFPEMKLRGLVPNFYMFRGAIYTFPRSVCLFCCRKIGGPIVGEYKNRSQIHECGI
jgi:hypothetical protein